MEITLGHFIQLFVVMVGGLLAYIFTYLVKERVAIAVLVVLIPFQIVSTKYGSLNVALTYLLGFAYLLQGRIRFFPGFMGLLAMMATYLISLFNTHPNTWIIHAVYVFNVLSGFFLFYIIYNFIIRNKDWDFIKNLLIVMNVLVLGYCAIQLISGDKQFIPFGVREFAFHPIRDAAGRLTGPFKNTHVTGEYLNIQTILVLFMLVDEARRSVAMLLVFLFLGNVFFTITLGDRAAFLIVPVASILFLYVFRDKLGYARIIRWVACGSVAVFVVSIVVVTQTDFNIIFDRIQGSVTGEQPLTRERGWGHGMKVFLLNPYIGIGPHLMEALNATGMRKYMGYPHQLILHQLLSVGIVGLIAFFIFVYQSTRDIVATSFKSNVDSVFSDIPKMGLLFLIIAFFSELRIEMFRMATVDYQHYFFLMLAVFLAFSHLAMASREAYPVNETALKMEGKAIV